MRSLRRLEGMVLCVAALLVSVTFAAPAQGAAGDPIVGPFYASAAKEGALHAPYPDPGLGFEGPCGLAVDSKGQFYVSDYYHHAVNVFKSNLANVAQLREEDPLDGPCGLAVDPTGNLYVNNFHRNVVKYTPSAFPFSTYLPYGPGVVIDSAHPTGVAVDPSTGYAYVNDRTYVAVYEPSGAPLLDEGAPLRIGLGSLGDAYGVAVSSYSGTKGYVYVPDAATDTVKVYDPAVDPDNPVATIDGNGTPNGSFVSLRDATIAIEQKSGLVYVADDLQPEYYERPEAAIYGFKASGAYTGRLKYNVVDARPPGLAVDNSTSLSQGRVYVTSGNSENAAVYAYEPDALGAAVFTAPEAAAPNTALLRPEGGATPPPAALTVPLAVSKTNAESQESVPETRRHPRRHRHAGQRHRRTKGGHR